jgi:hypothetical protein
VIFSELSRALFRTLNKQSFDEEKASKYLRVACYMMLLLMLLLLMKTCESLPAVVKLQHPSLQPSTQH